MMPDTYRLCDLVPDLPYQMAMCGTPGSLTVRVEAGRVFTSGWRAYITPESNLAWMRVRQAFPDIDPWGQP